MDCWLLLLPGNQHRSTMFADNYSLCEGRKTVVLPTRQGSFPPTPDFECLAAGGTEFFIVKMGHDEACI